ncbi:MAG: hypothetical protein ABI411_03250 [Tahibacter sp.]
MKRPHNTLLMVPGLLVLLAGAASAGENLAIIADQPDPIFKHGFEVAGAADCSARPPQTVTRVQSNLVTYPRGGGPYYRTGDMRFYLDIFGVVPPPTGQGAPTFAAFPGNSSNQSAIWRLIPSTYAAMEFTVPLTFAASTAYQVQFFQTGFLPENEVASMSISECPGDFRAEIDGACKTQWDGNDGGLILFVAEDSPLPASQTCHLTRGKTYYFNFVGASIATPATPSCQGPYCSMGVTTRLLIP